MVTLGEVADAEAVGLIERNATTSATRLAEVDRMEEWSANTTVVGRGRVAVRSGGSRFVVEVRATVVSAGGEKGGFSREDDGVEVGEAGCVSDVTALRE